MYNLFVSGDNEAWNGEPWQIELSRCVREYTDESITQRLGDLDSAALVELKRLPCIFAYETPIKTPPKFGLLGDVTKRQGEVRVQYQLDSLAPFLTADDLAAMSFELDIGKWELHRTHWAVKDVNLPKELERRGIILPAWAREVVKTVDITTHSFDVALSFPGESRVLVEEIALELEREIGPNRYFYDGNFVSQLARPSLDVLLQDIYRNRSKLVVVFLGSDYQRKEWCGVEFRAIKQIIFERDHKRVMFIRTDGGAVEGVFDTDGFIDAQKFSAAEIARFIRERVELLGV
jgi:hypothetical protein